jgi:hypothetical protein
MGWYNPPVGFTERADSNCRSSGISKGGDSASDSEENGESSSGDSEWGDAPEASPARKQGDVANFIF